jgi:hypothetical protein
MKEFTSSAGMTRKFLSESLLRAFEVKLLLQKALGAGIGGVGVVVEVAEIDNVDAEAAEDRNPCGAESERAAVAQHLVEVEMEVAGDGLESGDGLVDIVVGVGHHGLLRGLIAGPGLR